MPIKNTTEKWGSLAKTFHWSMAILVIGLLISGLIMVRMEFSPLQLQIYAIHKATGIIILTLIVLRIIWRLSSPRPRELPYKAWERYLSTTIHFFFYCALIGMPLSGWLMSSAANFPISLYGLINIPHLTEPNRDLEIWMKWIHAYLGYAVIAGVCLHIAGALKHHIIDRDITLQRILPGRASGLATCVIIGLISFLSVGQFLEPKEQGKMDTAAQIQDVSEADFAEQAEVPPTEIAEWDIIPERSQLSFTATQQGAPFQGEFGTFGGTIRFDADQLAWSYINVTVDTSDVVTGSPDRDQYITAPAWLAANKYEQARFKSNNIVEGTEGGYLARGELTIKGQTRALDLPFTVTFMRENGQDIAKANGSFTIKRLNYDVGEGQWSDTSTVGNQITVTIDLTAQKKK
jgi:cytochrome b561